MQYIYIICEGQTEEAFVKELLVTPFLEKGIFLQATLIGEGNHRGGNVTYQRLLNDITALLHHKQAYCTTFIDFYGLPPDFPGKSMAHGTHQNKHKIICEALQKSLYHTLGDSTERFIPYVQMYEFESLLFSNPTSLANGIGESQLATALNTIKETFNTPEEINDSYDTKPSKRITTLHRRYDKVIDGNLAALEIGLEQIRQECPLFSQWIKTLEELPFPTK